MVLAFWKVNQFGQFGIPLANARFRLYRYNGTTTPPDVFITSDMVGSNIDQWTLVDTRTSSTTIPMSMRIYPGSYFQLYEYLPPAGHRPIFGQWRITVNSANPPTKMLPTLERDPVAGALIPEIIRCTISDETYRIVNHPDFELPLTGGWGESIALMVAGTLMILLAMFAAAVVMFRGREHEHMPDTE